MDIHEWYSQLGRKSASLLSASERHTRAQAAARKRWGNANSKHTAKDYPICKKCGQYESYHIPKYAKLLGGSYHQFQP